MAFPPPFSSQATPQMSSGRSPKQVDLDTGWAEPDKPVRDWKKRALVVGLGLLSWVATYVGMLELIEANMGELPLVHKLIIGFSVAMLMTMVVWLLDEMFKPNAFVTKLFYAFGYVFLTIISIGFGFGFYWKVLESRSEASRSAEGAVTQVQGSLVAASTRMDQLTATLDQLTAVSTQKATTEKAAGTSCPNSKPGEGPRRKMREDDAARFSFAADFVKGRATAVKTEMGGLDVDLAKIITDDKSTIDAKSGTRNAFMQGLGRKLDNTVTGFNAFRTDPQLKQIRTDLAERAEKVTFPDSQGKTYSCPDPQLQTALRGVVRAIDQLPELEKPKIAAVEGSEATIEAFRRLTASFYGLLSFKMPPSADELRDLQKKAIQSVEAPSVTAKHSLNEQPGLSKRDYVPLAIALFVDLCLLLVSMGKGSQDRLGGLVPKMRAAEQGPVIQILSRFNEIHRDRQIRENFELFRHVVFDFHGDYYVAVPLDAPRKMNPREREDLRLETQLLSNLFASFEKEKIFTRVYSPFLTAGAVRKRLARQGSKFERSDAFRLYRFKDGAWSDIILGAVMGAAKRVEAEKRVLSARADETARVAAEAIASSAGIASDWATQGVANRPTARPTAPPTNYSERFGAYAPFAANEPERPAFGGIASAGPVFADNVHPLPQRHDFQAPSHLTRAPQAGRYEDDAGAANSNTAPAWQTQAYPTVTDWQTAPVAQPVADVLPFALPAGPRLGGGLANRWPTVMPEAIAKAETAELPAELPNDFAPQWVNSGPSTVTMTRVTESITVPVSTQAQLPQALMTSLFKPAVEPSYSSPPTLALRAPDETPTDRDGDTWSVADAALIRKYARPPAD